MRRLPLPNSNTRVVLVTCRPLYIIVQFSPPEKITFCWDVKACSLKEVIEVPEERKASVLRLDLYILL